MNSRLTPSILLVVLCISTAATGQEKLTLFADAAGTECAIAGNPAQPGIVEVHMYHLGMADRAAVQFLAPRPACWSGAIWVGDNIAPPLLVIGNTQSVDISIAYTECRTLPVYLGKINYFVTDPSPSCCHYPVIPSTHDETIISVGCAPDFPLIPISGGSAVVNETPSCRCQLPVSVEERTWGKIKSLYQ